MVDWAQRSPHNSRRAFDSLFDSRALASSCVCHLHGCSRETDCKLKVLVADATQLASRRRVCSAPSPPSAAASETISSVNHAVESHTSPECRTMRQRINSDYKFFNHMKHSKVFALRLRKRCRRSLPFTCAFLRLACHPVLISFRRAPRRADAAAHGIGLRQKFTRRRATEGGN